MLGKEWDYAFLHCLKNRNLCNRRESDISSWPSSSLRSVWRSSWGATHGSWSQAKTWPTRLFQFQGPSMTFRLFLPGWQLQHDVAPFQKQKLFSDLYHMECYLSYIVPSVHSQSPKPSDMYIYMYKMLVFIPVKNLMSTNTVIIVWASHFHT